MPAEGPKPAKARLLLVEDVSTPDSTAALALRAENYQVFLAGNCRQAVEICRTAGIDLLVLNSALQTEVLPQLVTLLSAEERPCPMLVIARSLDQLVLARDSGAEAVLMAPLELRRLGKMVNNLLAAMRARNLDERLHRDSLAPACEASAF
jgi:DNA-binding response OmpR family regulator